MIGVEAMQPKIDSILKGTRRSDLPAVGRDRAKGPVTAKHTSSFSSVNLLLYMVRLTLRPDTPP